jgi:hypothetical protein
LSANLDPDLDIQFLLTTHSPLVLASLEPYFDEETDKIFHLELKREDIVLTEHPFLTLGLVDYWYTSDIFGLSQARSLEAEKTVMKAEEIQEKAHPTKEEVMEVDRLLARYLSDFDTYWPHWIYFVKQSIGEKQIVFRRKLINEYCDKARDWKNTRQALQVLDEKAPFIAFELKRQGLEEKIVEGLKSTGKTI